MTHDKEAHEKKKTVFTCSLKIPSFFFLSLFLLYWKLVALLLLLAVCHCTKCFVFFFAIVILADTCCLPFDTVRIIIWPWRIMRSGRLVWSHTRHRARGGKWKSINISIEMRLLDSLLQESHSATGERIERMEKMKKKN